MKPFSHLERASFLEEVKQKNFDLVIIGGGITGTGIAREAAYQGWSVLLLERRDFGSATSSHSSKLIHGGLRYLAQKEIQLVTESLRERHKLLYTLAPHLVHPLPFILPVWNKGKHKNWKLRLGLLLYDLLAKMEPKPHRPLTPRQIQKCEPILRHDRIQAGFLYYDAQTDDARLTLETAISAYEKGARLISYAEVKELLQNTKGKIQGVAFQDRLTGQCYEAKAHCVVNATGPFANTWIHRLRPKASPFLRPTKGVHLILPGKVLPLRHAITFTSALDDRVMFALPWQGFTILGTTDTEDTPKEIGGVTKEDVDYILESAKCTFSMPLSQSQVLNTYAGWRPLIFEEGRESDISRRHQFLFFEEGFLSVGGGKLTTYRQMAEEAVKFLAKQFGWPLRLYSPARRIPLPGARHWRHSPLSPPYGSRRNLVEHFCQDQQGRQQIVPHLPYRLGEVLYQIRYEMALTLEDILLRRTQIGWKTEKLGLSAAPKVLEILAKELGWTEEEKQKEWKKYQTLVEAHESWRQEKST